MAQTHKFRKYKSLYSSTASSFGTGTSETITLASVSGLPTDTEITLTFDRVDSSGTATPTKMERITGTISGSNLTAYTRGVDGSTEQAHTSPVVEMIWNADDLNDMVDGILATHAQDGNIKSGAQVNDTTADHQYVLAVSELAADRTVTLPLLTGNDEFVFKDHTQTLTNKTLTSPVLNTGLSGTAFLDEDDMASDSATKAASQQSIKAYVDAKITPAGVILAYGGTAAPSGFLLCDGTSYLRADYAALFTAIGTAFGAADGTHFNVPDFRGRFLRGTDNSAGRDPDAAARTAMNTGGNTGDAVGSVQVEEIKAHSHSYRTNTTGSGGSTYPVISAAVDAYATAYSTIASTGDETRPINAGVNYIIKT